MFEEINNISTLFALDGSNYNVCKNQYKCDKYSFTEYRFDE